MEIDYLSVNSCNNFGVGEANIFTHFSIFLFKTNIVFILVEV